MTQVHKYLRAYIRVQAITLCLVLGTLGASLAAQRTRYLADGEPAAVQQEHALPEAAETIRSHLPDKQTWQDGVPFLSALPAPLGCAVGAVMTARELLRQAFIP